MKNEAHPIELAALAVLALGWALMTVTRLLLVPAVALLLTLAGWRPAPRAAAPQPVAPASGEAPPAPIAASEPAPLPLAAAVVLTCAAAPPGLEGLTVAQLRKLARAAGLPRALIHSGRRAQLLEALAAA